METAIPGIPTAPPPNADSTPAVVTPPVQPGTNPEARLEAIKARLRAAGTNVTPPKNPEAKTGDPKPAEKTEPKTDDSNAAVPPKFLSELGRLQTRVRELEPIQKQFESIKADAELAKEVKKLWGGTHEEKVSALAKLSGKDGLDELAALVHAYYKSEQDGAANGDSQDSPDIKSLKAMIAEQEKKISALESDRAKEKETATKTNADKENAKGVEFVKSFIGKNKARLELCAKPENIAEAVDLAQSASIALIEKRIKGFAEMSDEQKTAAFSAEMQSLGSEGIEATYLEALTSVEKEFEETGKRFSKTSQPKQGFNPDRYSEFVRPLSKPRIEVKTEELSKDPKIRFEQVRQRAIEKAEAGLYRR